MDKNELLRQLPAVDRLLNAPAMQAMANACPHMILLEAAQQTVAGLRQAVLAADAQS